MATPGSKLVRREPTSGFRARASFHHEIECGHWLRRHAASGVSCSPSVRRCSRRPFHTTKSQRQARAKAIMGKPPAPPRASPTANSTPADQSPKLDRVHTRARWTGAGALGRTRQIRGKQTSAICGRGERGTTAGRLADPIADHAQAREPLPGPGTDSALCCRPQL